MKGVWALSLCGLEAIRSERAEQLRGALSHAHSPRVPPLTMLGPNRPPRLSHFAPNIVKNGTPQIVLSCLHFAPAI
jgi:hypothetical protein